MERNLLASSISLIALLLILFFLGGCVGYSSVSVGVGVDDYWGPYHRYRPPVNHQYHQKTVRRHSPQHGPGIGRPHHGRQKVEVRRSRPAR